MRHIASLVMVMLSLAITGAPTFSQSRYEEELSQLSGTLRALMVRAERVQPRDEASRVAIKQELLELSKMLHRLEEEALIANLELQRKGNGPDRQLLLAASISKTLDLAQSLIGYYLDTRDKLFWSSALAAAQSARTMLSKQ